MEAETERVAHPGRMFYRQTLMVQQSAIELPFAPARIDMTYVDGAPTVVVDGADGERAVFSVAIPQRPLFLGTADLTSTVGIPAIDRSARFGDTMLSVAGETVEILDLKGTPIGQIKSERPTSLYVIGDRLAVYDLRGLHIYAQGDEPGSPKWLYTHSMEQPAQVARPFGTSYRQALFVGSPKGGGEILDFGEADRPTVLARYESAPWFIGTARIGTTATRIDGKTVLVFSVRTDYFKLAAAEVGFA